MCRIRLCSVLVIGSLLAMLLGSAPAAALAPNPVHTLAFTVKVAGLPKAYTLNLLAKDFGGGIAALQVQLTRKATTGSHPIQLHQWYFQHATFTCSAHVASCNLDTISSTGAEAAGRIHLTFSATGSETTKQDVCKFDHSSLGSHTSRPGSVTGTFRLQTHTTFFGTIRNSATLGTGHIPSSIVAKATKWNTSGSCPGPCQTYTDLQALGGDSTHVGSNWYPSAAKGDAYWELYTHSDDLTIGHRILGKTTQHFLTVTDNSPALDAMSLDLSPFAPFLKGSGTFTGGAPPTTSGSTCVITERNGTFNGSWTAKLDGWGTLTTSGSTLSGYAYKSHPGS
jgi:hypothetical protein